MILHGGHPRRVQVDNVVEGLNKERYRSIILLHRIRGMSPKLVLQLLRSINNALKLRPIGSEIEKIQSGIDDLLNVTPRTVAFHKYTTMDQFELKSSAELIPFAMKSSMVAASM
jgi:hypothetical protein